MGGLQSCVVASLTACSVYVVYVHLYSSHKLLKTNVLKHDRLPSFAYLYVKYLSKALTWRKGYLHATNTRDVVYTIVGCRLEALLLRRFCSAAGYGWDYPDTEYRDVPLCFPAFLCWKLLLMVLTDGRFRLSPAGLLCVRQTLKTLQPVDELKKGLFLLQVEVLEYRQTEEGAEVDLRLSATSRTASLVWESILTLLSRNKLKKVRTYVPKQDEPEAENVKQVEVSVSQSAGLPVLWSYSPYRLLCLPARLLGFTSPSLWMLSVCLAEIEKHRGVEAITAPVHVTARFKDPLLLPARVNIKFWESKKTLSFVMQQHGGHTPYMTGVISRSPQ